MSDSTPESAAPGRPDATRQYEPHDPRDVPGRPEHGSRPRARTSLWATALSLPPLALLAAAAWFGRSVRPGADDWCFLPAVRDEGITGLIGRFYFDDNGRVANAALVGAYAKFQVAGHQWFALVSGVLTLTVLWAVTALALRRARIAVPRGLPLLVAAMATALFLFATPNTYKTFYWPAASVSHTMPPVVACAALLPFLAGHSRRGRGVALAVALFAGLAIGTLSEETAIVVAVLLVTVLLLSGRAAAGPSRSFLRLWCAAAIAGTAAGGLVLITSPGSNARRDRFGAGTTSMLAPESLAASLRGFVGIAHTVVTTWQYVGAVAVGVLLGLLCRHRDGSRPGPPAHWPVTACAGVAALLVAGYLCTVITYPVFQDRVSAPSANRLWNDYLLVYVALLVGAGTLLGMAARQRIRRTGPLQATCAVLCVLVCFGPAVALLDLDANMRARAEKWDAQDRRLREGASSGARVLPYERLAISQMREPFGRQGRFYWPGGCVADYYRIDRVTDATRPPGRT
ncbi:DUF6056 family protein [Streptomyces hirsutus]|uniref:DUF6056 family protein n=1 Tax=Streptomyces hirsutus TaxID=35620 RepID=A0ABZ1GU52_9ACTN|nr:DUF6056 family protein [Streptomyces hirsutus]WSD09706.1 DUF6056 family protein [Streptomyces hirsutus]